MAPWTEGGLIERAKHVSLTDLCLDILSGVTGETSGRSVVLASRSRDGPLIAGRKTVFLKKAMVSLSASMCTR